jgi:hypothetical protein
MIRLGRSNNGTETGFGRKLIAEIKEAKARGKGRDRKRPAAASREQVSQPKSSS